LAMSATAATAAIAGRLSVTGVAVVAEGPG